MRRPTDQGSTLPGQIVKLHPQIHGTVGGRGGGLEWRYAEYFLRLTLVPVASITSRHRRSTCKSTTPLELSDVLLLCSTLTSHDTDGALNLNV
jgi:hypothetical protein